MAEAVVGMVTHGIKPLVDLITQQGQFLSGVSYQVELAEAELHLIRGFLKDADSRTGDDEVVRKWVQLIRDSAYDLDDVIESFALKVASKSRGGTVKVLLKRFACIFNHVVDRYKIGSEIEDIMNKLSHLRSSLERYNIRQISVGEAVASTFKRQRDRRLTYAHEVESHIVGLEQNTAILVKELVTEEKRHRVVSIWGMGGSGKTTLAKQVLLQNEVKRHFDCFAWLCISQQCEGRDVLEEVLIKLISSTQYTRKEFSSMRKDEIAQKVCSIQREKRCLVVLDDIWTQEAWNSIKAGFPINEETESRILLTTRKKEVALLASRNNESLHQPQALDEKQSWELFEKIVICGTDNTDSGIYAQKTEIGKKMLVHCAGLPLAIRVLAGVLSRRETVEEWNTVLRNVDVYIMRGTNVIDRENTGQEYGVSAVLALSYDDLPSQLKLCFLYLSQFPEDHEIPVKRLTQLWIAEGFITSMTEIHGSVETMEEVSYSCLTELVERSMVQVVKYGFSGKVNICRLHDLMRDLCLQKAEEENFLRVVNFSSGPVWKTSPIGKVRRLALYLDRNVNYEFTNRDGGDCHIRSLLYFAPEHFHQEWNQKVTRSVFNDFKLLRVLKFENIDRRFELPETIGNLVHLRFLSLKNSTFGGLTSSVSNLVLLQTLDLQGYQALSHKITNVFRNMEQLRHFYLPDDYTVSEKLSFATLCNLQTLVNVRVENFDLNRLVQLTNLRKLDLKIRSESGGYLKKLKDMLISRSITFNHLRSLFLRAYGNCEEHIARDIVSSCPHLYKLRLEGNLNFELPKEPLCYPNLTKIMMIGNNVRGEQIEILEKLPNLRVLCLSNVKFEKSMVFSQGGFTHLEILSLFWLKRLEEWRVEKGAMPGLGRLHIKNCQKLKEVPDGVQHITTLKELTIDDMPSAFWRRVREGGEDFYKIKHVPSLLIINISKERRTEYSGDSKESTVDAPPPDEKTEEIQAASTS
ncbi:hypothetical protein M0R45_034987 [Rubus argutus]|uniref:P-loop containing nucleoside triphosphate hydrolase, leucine-rich repeat domain, L n=1 Tax=Rubus argutus TaxID=59490 RepID=A0AAW1VVZ4_RUBAR